MELDFDFSKFPDKMKVRGYDRTELFSDKGSSSIVYTPGDLVEDILDMMPTEIWSNPDITFLNPCCKNGVFLDRIYWRLEEGLKEQIPSFIDRSDHIFTKQLFGLALTDKQADISRGVLYGASNASSPNVYTTRFKDREGNIKTLKLMVDGIECDYKQIIKEGSGTALQKTIEEAFGDMKFNVIIGNPPFQESTGDGTQARAIYNEFVEKSIQMSPDYIAMIIPSKWFGGGMGLNSFRTMMMNNKHIEKYVHYFDAKECFENVKIAGGVGYFLYNRGYNGMCNFTNIMSNNRNTLNRYLSDYKFVLANNSSVCIIDKVISKKEPSMAKIASPISLFGLPTTAEYSTMQAKEDDLMLYTGGNIGYISNDAVTKGREYVGSYCAMVGAATSGNADQYENIKVFTLVDIKRPGEVSTQAYIMIGKWDNEETAANCVTYLKTKFCRFLLQAALSSIRISADKFCFVPMQDFTKPWTDAELYKKYNLTKEEIGFIESTIRPME